MYFLSINNRFDSEVSIVELQIFEGEERTGKIENVILQVYNPEKVPRYILLSKDEFASDNSIVAVNKHLSHIYRSALKQIFRFNSEKLVIVQNRN